MKKEEKIFAQSMFIDTYSDMKKTLREFERYQMIPDERSRELSIVITKLEEAMMWFNKHRANRGYLVKSKTHV